MGLESGTVVPSMLTVSSSRDGNQSPPSVRLNSRGAWTPIHNDKNQFVQVTDDLNVLSEESKCTNIIVIKGILS